MLVAVSGGVDSMVLLHLLAGQAAGRGWQLAVAHFNHRLRGRASAADAAFVRAAVQALGWHCHNGAGDVRAHARQHGESVEMAARTLRHRFLARTARRLNCTHIALAHHADDQAELFFVRLLRGAGSAGLGGMAEVNPSPADAALTLVRPLLGVPKAALVAYAQAHGIRFREDASNASPDIIRNRIRHRLLPLLRAEFQPALDTVLARVMTTLAAEAEVTGAAAARWWRVRRPAFARLPVAVQRACLAEALLRAGCEPGFDLIEKLRTQPDVPVTIRPGEQVCRAPTATAKTNGPLLLVEPVASVAPPAPPAPRRLSLAAGGTARLAFGAVRLELRRLRGATLPPHQAGVEFFDAAALGSHLTLRHWLPGDRFQPLGLAAPAKLQDLFTNAKIPRAERSQRVVAVAADGRICWVEGLRIGEAFKLTGATKFRWRLAWQRLPGGTKLPA